MKATLNKAMVRMTSRLRLAATAHGLRYRRILMANKPVISTFPIIKAQVVLSAMRNNISIRLKPCDTRIIINLGFDDYRITCTGKQSVIETFLILVPILMISQLFVGVG